MHKFETSVIWLEFLQNWKSFCYCYWRWKFSGIQSNTVLQIYLISESGVEQTNQSMMLQFKRENGWKILPSFPKHKLICFFERGLEIQLVLGLPAWHLTNMSSTQRSKHFYSADSVWCIAGRRINFSLICFGS